MLYKLKLDILKNTTIRWFYKYLKKSFVSKPKSNFDLRHLLIQNYCKGKSFIDVGCMWGVNGYFSFLAEVYGANEVTGFDIYEPSEEFLRTHKERNSRVIFRQGDINSNSIVSKLGQFEVVYCTGLLYHVPDPVFTLNKLRQICSGVLILGTAVIPEFTGIKNMAVYYPFLEKNQRNIWKQNSGDQSGITTPFDLKQGYGNWIWGLTNSCLMSLAKTAGFDVIEKHLGRFYSFIVCKISDEGFLPVSGEWSEPAHKEDYKNFLTK